MKTTRFSRRKLLRSTGVALTLPLLESMTSVRAQSANVEAPRRMICINNTLGLHTPNLFPTQPRRDYELTPYLEPVKDFRDDFTVFSGLSHPDVDGGHPAELCYLTSAPHPRADNFKNSISLDQYAVEQLVPDTRFDSLVLASSHTGLSFTRSGVVRRSLPSSGHRKCSKICLWPAHPKTSMCKCSGLSKARASWIRF